MTPDDVNPRLAQVPFFRFLAIRVTAISDSEADAEVPFADTLIGNPVAELYHGGIIASVMEATAAVAVKPDFTDYPAKPINLTVDYLRPAVKGPLFARAIVTRKGKRMASVRALAWQEGPERPVAEGLYHFLLV